MAAPQIDAGSDMQASLQALVHPKLIENGWVDEENDTTLSEYVTMMIVNGKDVKGVQSELGGDLLGVGEDDAAVGAFAQWLFDTVRQIAAPQQEAQPQEQQTQPIPTVQDAQMEDSTAAADAPPTGPRSMRNGNQQGRGRGGRMLGQMNRQMDRSTDLPDNLRRIKGASGISSGRINSHAGRDGPPRGPRGNAANGIQRMMNGGRGGHSMNAMSNPMMGGPQNAQQQMQFMQMMEMQTNMMAQLIANGQIPNMNGGKFQHGQRGGRGGSRGGRGNKQLHAVNGKMPDGALPGSNTNNGGSGMDIDGGEASQGDKFSTLCRFNLSCLNASCGFAHQSPAAPPNTAVDMSDTCAHGAACTNHKCSARHPSPAQRNGGSTSLQDTPCRFYPNCTAGSACPYKHPSAPPCHFGDNCTKPDCKFAHPTTPCRYHPCLNPGCMYKHAEGQKKGKFEDKVWTADGSGGEQSNGKSDRFANFAKQTENGEEELVLPGQGEQQQQQSEQNGAEGQQDSQMETTQVVV